MVLVQSSSLLDIWMDTAIPIIICVDLLISSLGYREDCHDEKI